MATGDFTASTLAVVIEREDQLFGDAREKKLYEPKSHVLQKIVAEQTAQVSLLNVSALNQVRLAFLDTRGILADDCAPPDCNPTGPLLNTAGVVYTLDKCTSANNFMVEVPIGVDPKSVYANGIIGHADVIARGMLKQKKEIEEKIAAKALSLTASYAGTNADTYGENGSTVSGTNTTIPAPYWTPNLFPFFQQEADLNRFANPYMLHGRNLNLAKLEAVPNSLNLDQRSQAADFALIDSAWDPFTFGRVGLDNVSLMVDAGAIAFAARNVYSRTVTETLANQVVFSTPSISFPGVIDFDCTVTRTCQVVTVGTSQIMKWFDVYTTRQPYYNIIANPANGLNGDTGVLKFTRVSAAPATTTPAA